MGAGTESETVEKHNLLTRFHNFLSLLSCVTQSHLPGPSHIHSGDKIAKAAHADTAAKADTATEAEAAKTVIYAAQAAEAEKAVGYTRGGEIDKVFKKIFAEISALKGGN